MHEGGNSLTFSAFLRMANIAVKIECTLVNSIRQKGLKKQRRKHTAASSACNFLLMEYVGKERASA